VICLNKLFNHPHLVQAEGESILLDLSSVAGNVLIAMLFEFCDQALKTYTEEHRGSQRNTEESERIAQFLIAM